MILDKQTNKGKSWSRFDLGLYKAGFDDGLWVAVMTLIGLPLTSVHHHHRHRHHRHYHH